MQHGASSGLIPRINFLSDENKEKYQKELYILNDLIYKHSQYIGPIKIFEYLYKNDPEFSNFFQSYFNIELSQDIVDMFAKLITPKTFEGNEYLNQFALTKNISEVSNNFFNIIAGLTKCIVTYLNHSKNYDFQGLISTLLSNGFIQIHLHKTPTSSNEIKNITFEIKNTKTNDYRIRLDYGTNYQADRCQGKIKFKIK